MKTKIVPSRWLAETGRRLDPGPYLSGAIEAKELLNRLPEKKHKLSDVTRGGRAGVFHAGRQGRIYVNNPAFGVPFLGSTDILAADLSTLPFLSRKQVTDHPEFVIKEGWSLITRSGTVGRMAYARSDMDGMACSEHVMRVVPDPDKIPPGYLYAFLGSRFGVPLVASGTYGAIIQHIEPEHIWDIPVPRLGSKLEWAVHNLVAEASRLRSQYRSLMESATARVFDAVGLRDITPWEWTSQGPDLGFTVAKPWAATLRALNFNPRFGALEKKIRSVPHRELGKLCVPGTLHRGGRYKRIDAEPEFGVEMIGQKQLFWLRTEGRFLAKRLVPSDVYVEPGCVLVAARGTLGESEVYCRAEFVSKGMAKKAYSEDLLRILGDETAVERGYLFAFCRSETMFRFLRSISTGTKLQDNHPILLSQLPVPYPAKAIRAEIDAIVREAADAKDRALRLEDEGIRKVENTIAGEA